MPEILPENLSENRIVLPACRYMYHPARPTRAVQGSLSGSMNISLAVTVLRDLHRILPVSSAGTVPVAGAANAEGHQVPGMAVPLYSGMLAAASSPDQ